MKDLDVRLDALVKGTGYRGRVLDRLVKQAAQLAAGSAACLVLRDASHPSEGIVAVTYGGNGTLGLKLQDIDHHVPAIVQGGTWSPVPSEGGGLGRVEVETSLPAREAHDRVARHADLIAAALDHEHVPDRLAGSILEQTAELAHSLEERAEPRLPKEAEVELVRAVAQSLHLQAEDAIEAELGVLLYPLGALAPPDAGPATPAEVAADTVARVPGLEPVATVLRHLEERVDGEGVPDGLAGDELPIATRVVAAVRALAGPEGAPLDEGLVQLRADAGARFDADVVAAVARCVPAVS